MNTKSKKRKLGFDRVYCSLCETVFVVKSNGGANARSLALNAIRSQSHQSKLGVLHFSRVGVDVGLPSGCEVHNFDLNADIFERPDCCNNNDVISGDDVIDGESCLSDFEEYISFSEEAAKKDAIMQFEELSECDGDCEHDEIEESEHIGTSDDELARDSSIFNLFACEMNLF